MKQNLIKGLHVIFTKWKAEILFEAEISMSADNSLRMLKIGDLK